MLHHVQSGDSNSNKPPSPKTRPHSRLQSVNGTAPQALALVLHLLLRTRLRSTLGTRLARDRSQLKKSLLHTATQHLHHTTKWPPRLTVSELSGCATVEPPTNTVNTTLANSEVVYKYRTAGEISAKVLEQVKALCVDGANLYDICVKGDELLVAETNKIFKGKKVTKGVAFPTAISPNNCVAHLSPISTDPEAKINLKTGDVIKVSLGAQIDGYGGVVADTLVVSGGPIAEGPITGKVADVISAAWYATEVAVRTIKPGNKNWDVTRNVEEVCKAYGCTPAEGMLTHQQGQNILDGKKQIILNPTEGQKQNFETFTFEADEVYGLDILVSTGDGKVKQGETRTTIYKKTDLTYQLKMRSSRAVFSEVQKKAGAFPFSVRVLEDPTKGRMGLQECKNHGLVIPYDVHYEKDGEIVAEFFTTVGVTKDGNIKLATAPQPDFSIVKSDKKIENEDLLKVLAEPLKLSKKERKAQEAASA